jgi:hypothetical protein
MFRLRRHSGMLVRSVALVVPSAGSSRTIILIEDDAVTSMVGGQRLLHQPSRRPVGDKKPIRPPADGTAVLDRRQRRCR